VKDRWAGGAPEGADELDQIVTLSNRVGLETSLVQPGGGNTSIKVRREDADGRTEERLLVKGSGTDLRSIGRAGFTRLSMQGLSRLRERGDMSDQHMMEFMRDCMCDARDPLPSVETPLHSILPYRVIAHTHDVATMSRPGGEARRGALRGRDLLRAVREARLSAGAIGAGAGAPDPGAGDRPDPRAPRPGCLGGRCPRVLRAAARDGRESGGVPDGGEEGPKDTRSGPRPASATSGCSGRSRKWRRT
jgi:hypothetical protein